MEIQGTPTHVRVTRNRVSRPWRHIGEFVSLIGERDHTLKVSIGSEERQGAAIKGDNGGEQG